MRKKACLTCLFEVLRKRGVAGFCCIAAHLSKTKHTEQQLKHGRNDMGWFGRAECSDGYPQTICPMMCNVCRDVCVYACVQVRRG